LAAARLDRRADHDADRARLLEEPAPPPVEPGVVRDRHDQPARLGREHRAADAVLLGLAGRDARALREHQHPAALLEPLAALRHDLLDRVMAGAAVDGDRLHQARRPADERDPQDLALEDPRLRREDHHLRDRFPRRGVLPQRQVRAGRDVLEALDRVAEAADPARGAELCARPVARDGVAAGEGQPE